MSNGHNPRFSMPPAEPQIAIDPAAANVNMEWLQGMAKNGFTVVVVEVKSWADALGKVEAGFEERIGAELTESKLGHYDSLRTGAPFILYFYLHTETLLTGLRFIQDRLESLQLLPLCRIAHADCESKVYRVFYPAVAPK